MAALITGATSGIGCHMAKKLSHMGFDTILVGRNKKMLDIMSEELGSGTKTIQADLSKPEECFELYESLKNEKIEVLINNAGFGDFSYFDEGSIEKQLSMIDLNIKAVHILMKLFLGDFIDKGYGYILNVASLAAFLPGPKMAVYYGTKAYVYRLTMAVREELRRRGSKVYCGVLCPGPVATNFNKRAGVSFAKRGIDPEYCAEYAIEKMFEEKPVIIPGTFEKLLPLLTHLSTDALQTFFCWEFQKQKEKTPNK